MERRYSSLNQAPHWITAGCMFAILPLAWVMTNMKPDAAYREDLFNWHKTLGVIVLFITAFRAIWRAFDGPPPLSAARGVLGTAAGSRRLLDILPRPILDANHRVPDQLFRRPSDQALRPCSDVGLSAARQGVGGVF
jgi:hypothetical protein